MGLDLLDFFRGRHSWRKLLEMIQQLPSSSRYTEAMADDDELAESMPEPDTKDAGPRVSEYTATVARLDVLADRIGDLISLVHHVASGKPLRVKPARRPETACTRANRRRRDRRLGSLIDEVTAAQQRWAETHN